MVHAGSITVGVDIFTYLTQSIFPAARSPTVHFSIFAVSLVLLLGYVFVGGFAAVVASDLWQLKIIWWAVVLSLVSIVALGVSGEHQLNGVSLSASSPSSMTLLTFLVGVVVANLLIPMSQEASWQRFRAFTAIKGFSIRRALAKSITKSLLLWLGLILLAAGVRIVGPASATELASMIDVLEAFQRLDDWWFPLAVFPILTVAALSAMYSTADTCVSAILYLVDYTCVTRSRVAQRRVAEGKLPYAHYWAMGILFCICIAIFSLVRFWFHPTILQLVFSVFSNLIVVAPTVLMASRLEPVKEGTTDSRRTWAVTTSLVFGSGTFWIFAGYAIAQGPELEWLSQLAIVPGLVAAALPFMILFVVPAAQPRAAH